jgi:hypothetical protein
VQSTQVEPACPHAVSSVPDKHVLPEQQPMQVAPLHGMMHVPPLHVSLDAAQFAQVLPPAPQAVLAVPGMHVFPLQHPLHVAAVHGGAAHAWLVHFSFCGAQS